MASQGSPPTSIHEELPSQDNNLAELSSKQDINAPLEPPNPRFSLVQPSLGPSLRDSMVGTPADNNSPYASNTGLAEKSAGLPITGAPQGMADTSLSSSDHFNEKSAAIGDEFNNVRPTGRDKKRRTVILLSALVALVIIVVAVVVPVVLKVKPGSKSSNSNGSSSGSNGGGSGGGNGNGQHGGGITGGDGSTVTTDDGSTFTYKNQFGGFWYDDPNDPFNNNAQCNSWTPPLNQSWDYTKNKIYGVNIGGLFVLEPFITPALYEKYQTGATPAVDEWTLSQNMAADTAGGGLQAQMENHYATFITEQDIAEIAGAGLNWVRLPIPFWAINKWDPEPFADKISWKYILRLLGWCRKYGIRVNIDLHTIPGSQNGYNHSGKLGQVNFLNGVMGFANAERAMDYIRIITEFITQNQFLDVVPMFSIVNEALLSTIGKENLTRFYLRAHDMIREITGVGANKGPFITIHDGFAGLAQWADFLPGSDRIAIDVHPYIAFNGQPNTGPLSGFATQACGWSGDMQTSYTAFGVSIGGEFSAAVNDCGLYVNGISGTPTYGGSCSDWNDASTWTSDQVTGVKQFVMASMDALENWFFWTWKIGNSSVTNQVNAPFWSYQLGLAGGWIPQDPRTAEGTCSQIGAGAADFNPQFQPWMTGGAGAGTIDANVRASFTAWPPPEMSGVGAAGANLPSYTPTAPIVTLPPPTETAKGVDAGNGWADAQDTTPMMTAIAGCTYPDAWNAVDATVPAACAAAAAAASKRDVFEAAVTPAPELKRL